MNKKELYQATYQEISAVCYPGNSLISNLALASASIYEHFKHHWVGFYLVNESDERLDLGPFQGPLACTQIGFGKGVCGTAWAKAETQVVGNVHEFPGHIACSSLSNSEIVIPVLIDGKVVAVLDIDSVEYDHFDQLDRQKLEEMVRHIESCHA